MMTISIMMFDIVTLSIMTLNIISLFATINIISLFATLSINDTQYNDSITVFSAKCHYAECPVFYCYAVSLC